MRRSSGPSAVLARGFSDCRFRRTPAQRAAALAWFGSRRSCVGESKLRVGAAETTAWDMRLSVFVSAETGRRAASARRTFVQLPPPDLPRHPSIRTARCDRNETDLGGLLVFGGRPTWRTNVGYVIIAAMADLNSYLNDVIDEQDQILLREASDCLRTGARRAAYITVWLATGEALRRKFVVAQRFDGQAGQIVGQIQKREADHKAVDSLLIDKACEYGFVSDAEAQRLRHLYENRNIYGHPYEESPSDEAVIAAAYDAVDLVLGRDVRLRHGYLDRQVSRLTGDVTFLADNPDAISAFAEQVHRRSAPDVRLWFVRKMLEALAPIFADPSQDVLQRRGVQFLRAFLLVDPSIFDDWEAADDLPDHPEVLPGLLADSELFVRISDHAQDIVVNVLSQRAPADHRFLELLWRVNDDGVLPERHSGGFDSLLESIPIRRLTGRGLPLRAYWTKVVAALASHSWDAQNEAISVLRNAGPDQVANLDRDVQEDIGRQIMQAAEGTAWRAEGLLEGFPTADPAWPAKVIEGAAVEPFLAVDGQVRLKPGKSIEALRGLASVDSQQRDCVLDRIRDGVRAGCIRDPLWFFPQRDDVVGKLYRLATEPGFEKVSEIAEALEAKEDSNAGE